MKRESHGSLQLAQIQTERLLQDLVSEELKRRKKRGEYRGTFKSLTHYLGYQVRCSYPTPFDVAYGELLGRAAARLFKSDRTTTQSGAYVVAVRNLRKHPEKWRAHGVPVHVLMSEIDAENRKARVPSAMVDINSQQFRVLQEMLKHKWAFSDQYRNPGPIQYHGSTRWSVPHTLQMRHGDYLNDVEHVFENLSKIATLVRPGIASPQQVAVALAQTRAVLESLSSISSTSNHY